MDRYWLLTSTTYGTWLPGDERGFVSNVPDGDGGQVLHNIPRTPFDADIAELKRSAWDRLKCPPIYLIEEQASAIIAQFQETAKFRNWELCAASVMRNHFHLVVGVPGDPAPDSLLRDFKSYASRALNRRWEKPASGTWWTESGSRRKLPNENAQRNGVIYVRDQSYALAVWVSDLWRQQLGERGV